MPIPYDIFTADHVPEGNLKYYLCDLGQETKGEYCKNCESQCAYGKRYITFIGKKRVCLLLKDGELISEFATVADAAKYIGGVANQARWALQKGTRHMGFNFAWRYE